MEIKTSVKLNERNVDQLIKTPRRITEWAVEAFVRYAGFEAEKEAKKNAPVGVSGRLRAQIHTQTHNAGLTSFSIIGPQVDYAEGVEKGTPPHMPPVESLSAWVSKKLGRDVSPWALAMHIKKHGTKAHPFMQPARDLILETKDKLFDSVFEEALRKFSK